MSILHLQNSCLERLPSAIMCLKIIRNSHAYNGMILMLIYYSHPILTGGACDAFEYVGGYFVLKITLKVFFVRIVIYVNALL